MSLLRRSVLVALISVVAVVAAGVALELDSNGPPTDLALRTMATATPGEGAPVPRTAFVHARPDLDDELATSPVTTPTPAFSDADAPDVLQLQKDRGGKEHRGRGKDTLPPGWEPKVATPTPEVAPTPTVTILPTPTPTPRPTEPAPATPAPTATTPPTPTPTPTPTAVPPAPTATPTPGDRPIFSWSQSFDVAATGWGGLDRSALEAMFGRDTRYANGLDHVSIRNVGSETCLGVRYVPADNGSPRIEFPVLLEETDDMWLAYDLWLDDGWEPVRGGKLPGLAGGTSASGGNGGDGIEGWSARLMWGPDATLSVYAYHPDRPGGYGEWIPLGDGLTLQTGRWITITQHIWMNSDIGTANGGVEMFVDGVKMLERDMRWRATMDLGIDTFFFSTFYGGNSTSWSPVGTNYGCIDDVRISTSPLIG